MEGIGPQKTSVKLQDRDWELLRGLFESRVMTTAHANTLYFENNYESAKKRLQKLKGASLISERPRRPLEPAILFLTRKGLKALQDRGDLLKYPAFSLPALDRRAQVSDLTVRHELEVMDVKTAFHAALKTTPSYSIAEFGTWPLLHEFIACRPGHNGAELLIKPDGFIRIHESESDGSKYERAFFLELDRSTELQDKLLQKAACYFDYYKSGGFALRHGASREDYKNYYFRVLFVLQNSERRNNTAERLIQSNLPILNFVWLTTLREVMSDPFGPIWTRPNEYRNVTKGTPFDAEKSVSYSSYRRNGEREAFVESKIAKLQLLEKSS